GYVGYLASASGYLGAGRASLLAVLLSACIVVMKIRRRFRRLFGGSSAASDPGDFDDSEGAETPGPSEPAGVGRTDGIPWRRRLARFRTLFAEGLVARAELEDKQESATWAANDLAEAKRKLSALLNSIRPEQIEEAKAQSERLQTQRRYLEDQLRLLTVVSPV